MDSSNPRSLRAQRKKMQILQAAKLLFLENGFSATSMDQIRERAGVSKQTIYTYYSGKEELLFDVIAHQLFLLSDDAFSEVLNDLSFSTPEEAEKSMIVFSKKMLNHFMQADYLRMARMVVSEIVHYPELGKMFREAVPLRGLRNVEKLLEKANQASFITVTNTEIAARAYIGGLLTFIFIDGVLTADETIDFPTDDQIQSIVRFYMPSILTINQ